MVIRAPAPDRRPRTLRRHETITSSAAAIFPGRSDSDGSRGVERFRPIKRAGTRARPIRGDPGFSSARSAGAPRSIPCSKEAARKHRRIVVVLLQLDCAMSAACHRPSVPPLTAPPPVRKTELPAAANLAFHRQPRSNGSRRSRPCSVPTVTLIFNRQRISNTNSSMRSSLGSICRSSQRALLVSCKLTSLRAVAP